MNNFTSQSSIKQGLSIWYAGMEYGSSWQEAVENAYHFSPTALELPVLYSDQLQKFKNYIQFHRPPTDHISFHAPTKQHGKETIENTSELLELLVSLPSWIEYFVFHPHVLDLEADWSAVEDRIVIENMDAREGGKQEGKTAEELAPYFERFPNAGFCLDLAHAQAVDPSMQVAEELLDSYHHKLRGIHLSHVETTQGIHMPCTEQDTQKYTPFLQDLRHIPWILETYPSLAYDQMIKELETN